MNSKAEMPLIIRCRHVSMISLTSLYQSFAELSAYIFIFLLLHLQFFHDNLFVKINNSILFNKEEKCYLSGVSEFVTEDKP